MSDDLEELLSAYQEGAAILNEAVRGIEDRQLDARPVAGKWSVREVVCHLVDADLEYANRIKRVLVEDNPTLQNLNPDIFLQRLPSEHREISVELAMLAATRNHIAAILKSTEIEDFQRTGVHSSEGPMTLETLVERITNHIPHHVAFIEEKRAAM